MRMWHVPDLGSKRGEEAGWIVLADSADTARELVVEQCRRNFDDYYDGPDGQRDRSGDLVRNWSAASWDREMWRRWYHFGVRIPQKEWGEPDGEIGQPVAIEGPVYGIPMLGYDW